MTKISVIMSTYNGLSHIKEQLDSIRNQTFTDFSVEISDDGSTDGTFSFIEDYIQSYALTNWKVSQNESNLGWRKNFFKLLLANTADIIFISDQDDIWNERKVGTMLNEMEKDKEIYVLSYFPQLIDENKNKIDFPKFQEYDFKQYGKIQQLLCVPRNILGFLPGCSFAIRKELLPYLIEGNNFDYNLNHDAIIQFVGTALGKMYIYPEKLHSWRQYVTSTMKNENFKNRKKSFIYASNAWNFAFNFTQKYGTVSADNDSILNYCRRRHAQEKGHAFLGNSKFLNNGISRRSIDTIINIYYKLRGKYVYE